jgi:hypothetical protein
MVDADAQEKFGILTASQASSVLGLASYMGPG